jgi:hypothetical protein
MSRHQRVLDDGKKLVFGWDGPLASFFAQVWLEEPTFDNAEDEEEYWEEGEGDKHSYPMFDVGAGIKLVDGKYAEDSIRSTSELASRLAEGNASWVLTYREIEQLIADQIGRGMGRTPLQISQMDFIDSAVGVARESRDD